MSELVEKVATKIQDYFSAADRAYGEHDLCARSAIAAVAEWMIDEFSYQAEMIEVKEGIAAALRAAAGSAPTPPEVK